MSYLPADNPSARRDVNRLLDPSNLTVNTLGGTVVEQGLSPYVTVGGDAPEDPYVLYGSSSEQEPHTVDSYLAPDRRGLSQLVMGWDSPDAYYENELPAGSRDVSRYPVLQFRAGLNFGDTRNPYGQPQDFSVVLTDGSGHSASTLVSDWSRALFYPPDFGGPTPKLFLERGANSAVGVRRRRPDRRAHRSDSTSTSDSTGALVLSDLMLANQSLGMSVASTTPGVGSVVVGDSPPTEFVFRLSDPYDDSSVQPGDLTVNGVPADTVLSTTDNILTFRFASSPVTDEGLQTMAIADGAITSSSDGQPIAAFRGTFRFYAELPRHTTTTVSSLSNPSVYGQPVTFVANVSAAAPGGVTPTGTVEFCDGATSLGSAVIISGFATLSTASLGVGTHVITARYSGDADFDPSTSAILQQDVNQAATTGKLSSSSTTSVHGQAVTFTVVVSPVSPGSGTPTGTVTFKDGATSLGTVNLISGTATFTTSALTDGFAHDHGELRRRRQLRVERVQFFDRDGEEGRNLGVGHLFSQSLGIRPVGLLHGERQPPTSPGAGTPTGSVQFKSDGANLGSAVALVNGCATSAATSTLKVGDHTITASYSGDANFLAVTSPSFEQTVQKTATITVLVSSANPSVHGQSVTFTATVTAAAPGSGIPAGSVDLFRRRDRDRHQQPQFRRQSDIHHRGAEHDDARDHGELQWQFQ